MHQIKNGFNYERNIKMKYKNMFQNKKKLQLIIKKIMK